MSTNSNRLRTNIAALSLVAAGMVGGGVIAGTVAANAAGSTTSPTTSTATTQDSADQSKSQRSDEKLLTGTDATKAKAAALAAYPGATIQRVETDSDGVYEAHIVTRDGQDLIVAMDKNFAVTGTDTHDGHGGGHANDNDADDSGTATSGT